MKDWNKQLQRRHNSPMQNYMQQSPFMTFLSVVGLILFGAIAIPVLVGMLAAIPDIARYLKMRSM
jgi:hypothetical protein